MEINSDQVATTCMHSDMTQGFLIDSDTELLFLSSLNLLPLFIQSTTHIMLSVKLKNSVHFPDLVILKVNLAKFH